MALSQRQAPNEPSVPFNLGTDPLTNRALMNEEVAMRISSNGTTPRYPSQEEVVCMALNEIGRRDGKGFVYRIVGDFYGRPYLPNAPALIYTLHEWTDKDRDEWDKGAHRHRLVMARTELLGETSWMLPLDLKIEKEGDHLTEGVNGN